MNKLNISTRLMILIGLMSALLVAIGAIGLVGIARSDQGLHSVYEDRTVPMGQLSDVQHQLTLTRLTLATSAMDSSPAGLAKTITAVEGNLAAVEKLWKAYMATGFTPEETAMAKKFADDRARLLQEGVLPALAALRANDIVSAQAVILEKIPRLDEPLQAGIEALMDLQLRVAKEEYDAAAVRYATARWVSIGSILAGVLFAVFFGLALMRSLSRSLGEALSATQAVARGDLTYKLQLHGSDEVTKVLLALSEMQTSLSKVVTSVRQGSHGVATASAQIASGNHDLSARTENQASALEQTSASMEQLGATVRQNADSAQQANQLARSASSTALRGGEEVAQVVLTMQGINDSSRKIADIIGVIDGIAFQTNILALNAAVEAARAGEQGRGFAVVASEVRSLAGRSAAAAKEIKSLIGASVEQVQRGSVLVDQAGVTMGEVVNGIQRVTDLMGEISAASGEQSQGVAQVGEAVTQMDRVTQQNAALVEQMAAAAGSLKAQAQDLVGTVAVFKLEGGAPDGHRAAPVLPLARTLSAKKLAPKAPLARLGERAATRQPQPARPQSPPSRLDARSASASQDHEWESF